jgi:hypothetical protein
MPVAERASTPRWALALASVVVVALLFNQFLRVSPTNFGGADEWLFLSLNSKGVLNFPYSNRPLTLFFAQPATWLAPASFVGYWILHTTYLALTGVFVLLLVRRLVPGDSGLAYLAGAIAVSWAPLDMGRLATVQVSVNAGVACCAVLALFVYVASWARGQPGLLAVAAGLALVASRSYEGVLGLLAGAPLLMPFVAEPARPGLRNRWLITWAAVIGGSLALAAWPYLAGRTGSLYQTQVMGLDLHPLRYGARLLRQYGFLTLPLVRPAPASLLQGAPAVAIGLFLAGAWAAGLAPGRSEASSPRRLAALAALGLALAGLSVALLAVSPSIDTPTRTQVFAAAGFAIFLAAALRLGARFLGPGLGALALGVAGAYVVALGAGHTVAMQGEWNRISFHPAQRATLVDLVRQAPRLEPNTLVLLIDETGAWPFGFTFRHAVSYLYGRRAVGHVLGADPFLYQLDLRPTGLDSSPWPVIRGPWKEEPSHHGFDEVVIFRRTKDRGLVLVEEWGGGLPAPPESSRYAPRQRIEAGAPPLPQAAVLGP